MDKIIGCWGVITRDKDKMETVFSEIKNKYADDIFNEITYKTYRRIEFSEGNLLWLRPTPNIIRGIKFTKIWLDIELIHDIELMNIIRTSVLDYNKNVSLI